MCGCIRKRAECSGEPRQRAVCRPGMNGMRRPEASETYLFLHQSRQCCALPALMFSVFFAVFFCFRGCLSGRQEGEEVMPDLLFVFDLLFVLEIPEEVYYNELNYSIHVYNLGNQED